MHLSELSNGQVVESLKALVGEGNRIVAKIVAYLVEVEDRRIHLELACSSMFDLCTRKLGFSEGEAFRRITAARLARRFPMVIDAIASGRVHLSSLVLLRDHFSEDNIHDLLEQASGKSKRDIELLVARLAPKPDVAPSIRKVTERVTLPVASAMTSLPASPPKPPPSRDHEAVQGSGTRDAGGPTRSRRA
jgi:translation initiation factor 2 alpha subunit (eIF-2alpha)